MVESPGTPHRVSFEPGPAMDGAKLRGDRSRAGIQGRAERKEHRPRSAGESGDEREPDGPRPGHAAGHAGRPGERAEDDREDDADGRAGADGNARPNGKGKAARGGVEGASQAVQR